MNQIWGQLDYLVAQKMIWKLKLGTDFDDFPIQMAEKGEKRPNFDESYLSNRFELRIKWAHFGN